ncbi:hypothetical protein ACHQM5_021899 [Ranunculus cassubicifolius]
MECSSWPETMDHKRIVQELVEGRDLTTQLQNLIQKQKPLGSHGVVAADNYVEKILGSFVRVISMLSSSSGETITGVVDMCESPLSVTTVTQVSSPFSNGDSVEKRKIPAMKDRRGAYKRRKSCDNTLTKLTDKPIEDGYAWRKYGQKEILNAKHPRNYFRCTHKIDQGCLAIKQVQQTEDEPPMYQTTYMGNHTCTNPLRPLQIILDPSPSTSPQSLIFNFKPNPTINSKQDLRPLFASFPSFKLEPKDEQEEPVTLQYQCSLDDQYFSNDLSQFETSQPTSMLASSSSGSDHGDVISSVYSCTTSPTSLDLDLVVDNVDFNDDVFLDEFF